MHDKVFAEIKSMSNAEVLLFDKLYRVELACSKKVDSSRR